MPRDVKLRSVVAWSLYAHRRVGRNDLLVDSPVQAGVHAFERPLDRRRLQVAFGAAEMVPIFPNMVGINLGNWWVTNKLSKLSDVVVVFSSVSCEWIFALHPFAIQSTLRLSAKGDMILPVSVRQSAQGRR